MKKLLIAKFVALLMAGGGENREAVHPEAIDLDDNETRNRIIAEAIDYEKLEGRGEGGEELYYAPNKQTPYSGWMKCMDNDGQIRWLFQCKDGKYDGPSTWWYGNGRKSGETTYKDGKKMTVVVWKPNGEKCPVTNFVNGNGVVVVYNEDGTERVRLTYKDGERVKD